MRTCFSLSSLACASLIALACTAQAQAATFPVYPDTTVNSEGLDYTLDSRTAGVLTFSSYAAGAMDVFNAKLTSTGGATLRTTVEEQGYYTSIDVKMPVTSVTANTINLGGTTYIGGADAKYQGGLSIQIPVGKPIASRGGSISLSNLHVDAVRQQVFADVVGGNDVGSISQLAVWNFSPISYGNQEVVPTCTTYGGCHAIVSVNNKIGNLTLTQEGFEVFSRSLNLTDLGKSALASVDSFGTITTSVPEPSSWALAVAGMLGIGVMKRRRATTTH
ncbi:MAG: PEP-CTERM sorting domain-containing protein [Aquabacterium sp.]